MTVDLQQLTLTVDFQLFHRWDCLSNPTPVLEVIEEIKTTFREVPFDGTLLVHRIGQPRAARLKSRERNWSKVLAELQEGKLSMLLFSSRMPNTEEWQLGVAFGLAHELDRRTDPDTHRNDDVSLWVKPALFDEGVVTVEMCLHVLQFAWERLGGVYGFADVFVGRRLGFVNVGDDDEEARITKAKGWSYEVFNPRIDVRLRIPDVYWLNLLNAHHTELLGGIDRIRESIEAILPAAQLRPLAADGLSIQISPSPLCDSWEAFRRDHAVIEMALTPLVLHYDPAAIIRQLASQTGSQP